MASDTAGILCDFIGFSVANVEWLALDAQRVPDDAVRRAPIDAAIANAARAAEIWTGRLRRSKLVDSEVLQDGAVQWGFSSRIDQYRDQLRKIRNPERTGRLRPRKEWEKSLLKAKGKVASWQETLEKTVETQFKNDLDAEDRKLVEEYKDLGAR